MTPMTRLKDNINLFQELIGEKFQETVLNKSKPKSFTPYNDGFSNNATIEDKGVKNDFIKIFKVKFNKQDTYSMAFSFDYIDLEEKNHKVQFSVKFNAPNKNISSSKESQSLIMVSEKMSVEEFKIKLNNINKVLKEFTEENGSPPYNEVIDSVAGYFIPEFTLKADYAKKINSGKKRLKKVN